MKRPFVSLKLATSLDGKIALANGKSKWITGEKSRKKGRELRGLHDAIAIGANTALLDNPRLTSRSEGAKDPVRVIYDSRLRLAVDSNIAQSARDVPVIIMCSSLETPKAKPLEDLGIVLNVVAYNDGLDIGESLVALRDMGHKSLLVEGGGTLAASFLKGGFVDEIHWFRAPIVLGGDGRSAIGNLGIEDLSQAPKYKRKSMEMIESDTYEILELLS